MSEVENKEIQQTGEEEAGASMVEYALLVALIAVICILALQVVGKKVSQQFSNVASAT